jgi:hypothetical protein
MDETDDIMREPGEQLRADCRNLSHELAKASYRYREGNPWTEVKALNDVVEHFVTELWDWKFSQTEIREAFEEALAGMNQYAAGQERRC